LIDDYDLIVSSFQSQYGIRLSKEIHEMPWQEFRQLMTGISPDTALGRIVSIRAEDNEDVLKNFTKEQHRIRNEWLSCVAKEKTNEQTEQFIESMRQAFIEMAGGRDKCKKINE
jgi:hypothetical protein